MPFLDEEGGIECDDCHNHVDKEEIVNCIVGMMDNDQFYPDGHEDVSKTFCWDCFNKMQKEPTTEELIVKLESMGYVCVKKGDFR